MARYSFLSQTGTDTATDFQTFDFLAARWTAFEFINNEISYTLSEPDTRKFYNVSQTFYGTVEYEDLLLYINGIADPFNLIPGTTIRIPSITDILAFQNKIKSQLGSPYHK
jgi:hypothetical protein